MILNKLKKSHFNLICLILCVLIIYNLNISMDRVVSAGDLFIRKETILIDVGHGGEDGGAIGLNSVVEKNINLQISLVLGAVLSQNGYKVLMTRTDDVDLADKNLNSISDRKRSDMYNRLEFINTSNADLVISIHQNTFSESKYNGLQAFYSKENSREFAEILQNMVRDELQNGNDREAKLADNIYLLDNSVVPMVVVECGFISNPADSQMLQDESFQDELAHTIFLAIEKYFA